MLNDLIYIGKVAAFRDGYIFIRFTYNKFISLSNELKVGIFLSISSDDRYIIGQVIDIYDVAEKEEQIRTTIANNSDITSTERDIYLYVELKVKPLLEKNGEKLDRFTHCTLNRLKDVFLLKNKTFVISNFLPQGYKFFFPNIGNFDIHGKGFLIGISDEDLRNIIKINNDQNLLIIDYSNINEIKYNSSNTTLLIRIRNRIELLKASNQYIFPDFIIGKKLLKIDYNIISNSTFIISDYLPIFSYHDYYLIYKGVIII